MSQNQDLSRPVSDIMTRPVISVQEEDTIAQVLKIFNENMIHHLPVLNHSDQVIGIISKHDLAKIIKGTELLSPENSDDQIRKRTTSLAAKHIMQRTVVTLQKRDPIQTAADILLENLFHCLPVVDDQQRLLGIVTGYDLLVYAYHNQSDG